MGVLTRVTEIVARMQTEGSLSALVQRAICTWQAGHERADQ